MWGKRQPWTTDEDIAQLAMEKSRGDYPIFLNLIKLTYNFQYPTPDRKEKKIAKCISVRFLFNMIYI